MVELKTKSTSALAGWGQTVNKKHNITVTVVGFHIHRVGERGRESCYYVVYFFFLQVGNKQRPQDFKDSSPPPSPHPSPLEKSSIYNSIDNSTTHCIQNSRQAIYLYLNTLFYCMMKVRKLFTHTALRKT